METRKLKPHHGYWDVTQYPIGGCFCRADKHGLEITDVKPLLRPYKGANASGRVGEMLVAFHTQFCEDQ